MGRVQETPSVDALMATKSKDRQAPRVPLDRFARDERDGAI